MTAWQTIRSLKETAPRSSWEGPYTDTCFLSPTQPGFWGTARVGPLRHQCSCTPTRATHGPRKPWLVLGNSRIYCCSKRQTTPEKTARMNLANSVSAEAALPASLTWLPQGPSPPSPGFLWGSFHREDGWPVSSTGFNVWLGAGTQQLVHVLGVCQSSLSGYLLFVLLFLPE